MRRLGTWQHRRGERRRTERLEVVLERRAHYLELLSVTTKPGLLLHILDAIDQTDAELDALDPAGLVTRDDLVAVPRT